MESYTLLEKNKDISFKRKICHAKKKFSESSNIYLKQQNYILPPDPFLRRITISEKVRYIRRLDVPMSIKSLATGFAAPY